MKKLLIGLLALVGVSAFACPSFEGHYEMTVKETTFNYPLEGMKVYVKYENTYKNGKSYTYNFTGFKIESIDNGAFTMYEDYHYLEKDGRWITYDIWPASKENDKVIVSCENQIESQRLYNKNGDVIFERKTYISEQGELVISDNDEITGKFKKIINNNVINEINSAPISSQPGNDQFEIIQDGKDTILNFRDSNKHRKQVISNGSEKSDTNPEINTSACRNLVMISSSE